MPEKKRQLSKKAKKKSDFYAIKLAPPPDPTRKKRPKPTRKAKLKEKK